MRGIAYRRKQRAKHIKRKENIIRAYRLDNPPHKYNDKDLYPYPLMGEVIFSSEGMWFPYWTLKNRGQLDKGKIHCGCGMCMAKTRNKGKRRFIHGNYAPAINYKPSDLRKINKMVWDENNWEQEKEDILFEEEFDEKYGWLRNKISEEKFDFLKNF